MTHKLLEDKLICGGITAPEQLTPTEQAALASSPQLQALLAENAALAASGPADCPPPPNRERLLSAVYAADGNPFKETTMIPNLITRSFAGKHPALRLALGGVLLLAVVALSLLLPRGYNRGPATPAWAAAEGYLLAFDFGDADMATVQPVIDQLKAKVTAFKQAHNLPIGQSRSAPGVYASDKKIIIRHEMNGQASGSPSEEHSKRVVVMVQLPDAKLVDDLKKELAGIPGLPAPELTDATWFTEKGLPDPTQPGINLSLNFDGKQHVFNFPDSATKQQIESEVNTWLAQNKPDFKFTVKVTLSGDGQTRQVDVRIEGKGSKDGGATPGDSAGTGTP